MKNYYEILGAAKGASEAELKKAYRKLARELHPDVNKAKDAEVRFKEVGEAWEVLKDSKTRALYDRFGDRWREAQEAEKQGVSPDEFDRYTRQGATGRSSSTGGHYYGHNFTGTAGQEDVDEILRGLFGRARSGGGYDSMGGFSSGGFGFSEPEPEPTVHELPVTLQELYHGGERMISLQSWVQGADGPVAQTKQLKVKIPKGMTDGSVIRLGGKGGSGLEQELHIRLVAEPDAVFGVQGYDLQTTLPVAFTDAALGAKLPVQLPAGSVRLNIPAGSQSGRVLRLRGKGLPRRSGGAGDLLVKLEVAVPEQLSSRERELLEELRSLSTGETRGQRATV